MEKVTFLESIIKIMNLIASVPFFIEILILTVILLIAMLFFYFRKSRKGKITSLIIYIVTLLLLPISHFSFFVQTIDKIVENYIKILYFPSCYVYILLLIITDISGLKNVIKNVKKQEKKWYDSLDLIYFFLFQFLFFLILRIVVTENIDVFERAQLYSNPSLTSLLQISSYLFWIRTGIKIIAFIVNRLSKNNVVIETRNTLDKDNSEYNGELTNLNVENVLDTSNANTSYATNGIEIINKIEASTGAVENKTMDFFNDDSSSVNNNKLQTQNSLLQGLPMDKKVVFVKENNIDNNKYSNVKLSSENLEKQTTNNMFENSNSSLNNSKTELNQNIEYDIELNAEDEVDNYFDDFYE